MVSLQVQREKNVQQLVEWLKSKYPSILERLREKTYWHYDKDKYENVELTLDDLFKTDKNRAYSIMGAEVLKVLKEHIANETTWSSKTQLDYARAVMRHVGCKLVNYVWYCKLTLD